jgi:hypothetical protein
MQEEACIPCSKPPMQSTYVLHPLEPKANQIFFVINIYEIYVRTTGFTNTCPLYIQLEAQFYCNPVGSRKFLVNIHEPCIILFSMLC